MNGASFSPDRTWRYSLTRDVGDATLRSSRHQGGTVTFVGLNPSTADETIDDPTVRRCIRFAADWGYTRLQMMNLYAYRATRPRNLFLADDPVGPGNDAALAEAFAVSDRIIVAWGAHAKPARVQAFAETFGQFEFWALGLTMSGAPRHPLYLRADSVPFQYDIPRRT